MASKRERDMLAGARVALLDLWHDAQQRPKVRHAGPTVRRLVVLHLGENEGMSFDSFQHEIDLGLRDTDPDERLVPATDGLGEMYERLAEKIFGKKESK